MKNFSKFISLKFKSARKIIKAGKITKKLKKSRSQKKELLEYDRVIEFTDYNKSYNRKIVLFSVDKLSVVSRHFVPILKQMLNENCAVIIYSFEHKKKFETSGSYKALLEIKQRSSQIIIISSQLTKKEVVERRKLNRFRVLHDCLRYSDPVFSTAFAISKRAQSKLQTSREQLLFFLLLKFSILRKLEKKFYKMREYILPSPGHIVRLFEVSCPSVLIASRLTLFGCDNVDFIKCARKNNIPSILLVASWDNLTNKGYIKIVPDKVIVWNKHQALEAVNLHDVSEADIEVTGTATFDDCFKYAEIYSNSIKSRKSKFSQKSPYLLYVGSSSAIIEDEVKFVKIWIHKVRSYGGGFENIPIVIRPHPTRWTQFTKFDFQNFSHVKVVPDGKFESILEKDRKFYFGQIAEASAVIGINTSAFLEAAILKTPCFTIIPENMPEISSGSSGTLHFELLLKVADGILYHSTKWDEHLEKLFAQVYNENAKENFNHRAQMFTSEFIRPNNIALSADKQICDQIMRTFQK